MYKYYRKSEKREKLKEDILNLNHTPAAVVVKTGIFQRKFETISHQLFSSLACFFSLPAAVM